jgi:DNA polymerase-3 subunit beta
MNFVVSSNELNKHLQSVSRVINSKNTLPILDNFIFEITENKLIITGSDLESTVITAIELDNIDGSGKIALEARKLLDILKEFPEQPLTFNINNETFVTDIVTETGKFSVVGLSADDFPVVPELASDNININVASDVILSGIEKTLFATANDELRPVMNGIFCEMEPGKITFVASDSHKLVRYIRTDVEIPQATSFILPKKSASLIKGLLSKDDTIINANFDEKNSRFTIDNYTIICRLIEGNYPSYNSVIPQDMPNKLLVDRLTLLTSLKRVTVFSNQASYLVKLKVSPNELIISAKDVDFASSGVERASCQYDGDDMEIGFKGTFLQEIVANLSSPDVVIQLSDPSRAAILIPNEKDTEAEDVLMLIMPMML